jgi:uncharacterized phage infection (PIP) family protein YhgE
MHGFMASSEQAQLRQAQETKALQAQNNRYHDQSEQLQQQLQKLQQQLRQTRQENANLQAKDQQIQSNYQKLSTASKKLAQQYKALEGQDAQLRQKDQQEANQINALNKEKGGLVATLRKFKGIISAQSQELDSAISGAGTGSNGMPDVVSAPQVEAAPQAMSAPEPLLPDPTPLNVAPAAPVPAESSTAMEPLPSLPEAPPAVVSTSNSVPFTSNSVPPAEVSSTADSSISDMGPLELGPPPSAPVQASAPTKPSIVGKPKGKKAAPQQSSLEKDLNSLSDVRKGDEVPLPGADPDVSKIAQADDQVLQMARDAGFLPAV